MDPKHTAMVIKNYLQYNEQEVLEVMAWSLQNSGLNIINCVWYVSRVPSKFVQAYLEE